MLSSSGLETGSKVIYPCRLKAYYAYKGTILLHPHRHKGGLGDEADRNGSAGEHAAVYSLAGSGGGGGVGEADECL